MPLQISTYRQHLIHSWNRDGLSTGFLSEDRFMPPVRQFIVPSPDLITILYRWPSPYPNPLGVDLLVPYNITGATGG